MADKPQASKSARSAKHGSKKNPSAAGVKKTGAQILHDALIEQGVEVDIDIKGVCFVNVVILDVVANIG